jgi:hypothetical protein
MIRGRALPLLALVTLCPSLPGSVAADSCGFADQIDRGFLVGTESFEMLEVPRNVAVLNARLNQPTPPYRIPIGLEKMAIEGLWRPSTPLEPNIPIVTETGSSSWDQMAVTTDKIDSEPPTAVEVLDATWNECGTALEVDLEEPPSDDQTPAEHLVYAVYSGTTAEQAASNRQPTGIWRGNYYLTIYSSDPWVAISVLDYAGNESSRSKSIEVMSASSTSSCAASGPKHESVSATILALLLCAWVGTRTTRWRL